jgi:hypothetical protein
MMATDFAAVAGLMAAATMFRRTAGDIPECEIDVAGKI